MLAFKADHGPTRKTPLNSTLSQKRRPAQRILTPDFGEKPGIYPPRAHPSQVLNPPVEAVPVAPVESSEEVGQDESRIGAEQYMEEREHYRQG